MIIRGYPGDHGIQLWTHSGKIIADTGKTLRYTIDTAGGQSGAPIYSSDNQVWGIHVRYADGGTDRIIRNEGVKINEQLFRMIGGRLPGGEILLMEPIQAFQMAGTVDLQTEINWNFV